MSDKINIGIVDTKTSNIQSVIYACKKQNFNINIIEEELDLKNYKGLIIPGVGSFKIVMENLRRNRIDNLIYDFIDTGKPLLFICVGLQILFESSEEHGNTNGLSILKGQVKKIPFNYNNKTRNVPIIGWNKINLEKKTKLISEEDCSTNKYYFIHSYFADVKDRNNILTTSVHNDFTYCSSVNYENIYATQFHPEKSGEKGLKIYSNFRDICSGI